MINAYKKILFFIFLIIYLFIETSIADGQETNDTLYGTVYESGLGVPLKQAIVSDASTGEYTSTDENGKFSIFLTGNKNKIIISLPGYHTSSFYTGDQKNAIIYLTKQIYKSDDQFYSTPVEEYQIRNASNSVSLLTKVDFNKTNALTLDQAMNGKVAGMRVVEHSGMPGHNSWINIRGISSLFAKNQPLVFIDGMIHETRYPLNCLIHGHMYNPIELVDPDDIVDVTVIKTGETTLGSAGSNGTIFINTEQSKETSTAINFKISGGVSLTPSKLDVMDAGQYKTYFTDMLTSQGYSSGQINTMYPWLYNGPESSDEYYRYNNNTDWQKEMFKLSSFQKYHFFIKGGDDIATYNVSTGYLRQGSSFENWRYARYNLRLNGKINITRRFSVVPNTKLSLSDTYLSNMGPNTTINPVLASLLNPPLAGAYERSEDGAILAHFDDVGVFNTSNPAAIIENSLGSGRNVHLISSIKAILNISQKLSVSNLIGINFNNDRESNFLPDIGVVTEGLMKNSPRDMVNEFRSTQNFTTITYKNITNKIHQININAGIRYMNSTYKNNLAIDYNTPTDDFRSLGRGSGFEYLRVSDGEVNGLKWISYFGQFNYNFSDIYYITTSWSVDGYSALNKNNRYNVYPSIYGAWRITENIFNNITWLNDLKLRASWDLSGNMFSNVYSFSDLYYTGRRYNNISVIVRDYNPNYDLKMEKKSTINAGFDISMNKKAINLNIDYYYSFVNNLIINQQLPFSYGFTDYFDNGGKLVNSGIEMSCNAIKYLGNMTVVFDATVATQFNQVKKMDFLDDETSFLIINVNGAEYIISENNPVNAFYGYKTKGIYNSDTEANGMIGPNGREMGAGDVIFEDTDGNNTIDDKDKQIIGNPNPDIFGGFSGSVSYKMFEFAAIFNYSIGNDIYNYVRQQLTAMDSYENQSPEVMNRWVSGNNNASLPKVTFGDPVGNNEFSDRWIEDGSYLRLKEFRISCSLNQLVKLGKEMTVYISGSNLLTLTKYTGYDPETLYLNDPFYLGLDFGKIPSVRTIILGLKLDL